MGCPLPLAFVFMAERFGGWPWELEDVPIDKLYYYMNVIGAEGKVRSQLEGLPDDEPLLRDD